MKSLWIRRRTRKLTRKSKSIWVCALNEARVDLRTMKKKLEEFKYQSKAEFVKDLDRVFENAKAYYKKKTKNSKYAEELQEFVKPLLEKVGEPTKEELEGYKAILEGGKAEEKKSVKKEKKAEEKKSIKKEKKEEEGKAPKGKASKGKESNGKESVGKKKGSAKKE